MLVHECSFHFIGEKQHKNTRTKRTAHQCSSNVPSLLRSCLLVRSGSWLQSFGAALGAGIRLLWNSFEVVKEEFWGSFGASF